MSSGNPNGGAIHSARCNRNRILAAELAAKGTHPNAIALQLGIAPKTVRKYIRESRKEEETAMPEHVSQANYEKKAPIGALPATDRTLLGDYVRDETPARPPKAEWFNNRAMTGHDRDVIAAARAAAREADALAVLGKRMGVA